jgi:hypothetical protein
MMEKLMAFGDENEEILDPGEEYGLDDEEFEEMGDEEED